MLRELTIENLVLIDRLRLHPRNGINVFTGETGSGKSMIIDALGLLTGERGRSDLIRANSNRLLVEGVFDWPQDSAFSDLAEELGLEAEDDCVIVSREITANGRNTARINGRVAPLSALRSLSPWLLNIHAQGDTQELLASSSYLDYVDQYDSALSTSAAQLRSQYEQFRLLEKQLHEYQEQQQNLLRERDFLEFQIQEIAAAALTPGEEEELEERHRLMMNAGQMLKVCEQTQEWLFNSPHGLAAEELIGNARKLLSRYQDEPALASIITALDDITYTLEDCQRQISQLTEQLDFEPGELEQVEERIHHLSRLFKKYGSNSKEVLQTGQELQERLETINLWEEKEQELKELRDQAESEYYRMAEQVSCQRQKAAQDLEQAVQKELIRLAMPKARFSIQMERKSEPGPQGIDKVTFLFSDNPGQEARPLHRIASGGELSRLALALKVVLVNQIPAQVFVFDEVDAGMSGHALSQVAERIAALSRLRQVLMVTHAPMMAAYADNHFVISKESDTDLTYTKVQELTPEQVVWQLVQMMGDSHAPEMAYQYAQELRLSATNAKKNISQVS